LRDLKSQEKNAKRELVSQNDKNITARMRQVPSVAPAPQDYTYYYVAIGGLTLAIAVLKML
jgi:hypothetical protein